VRRLKPELHRQAVSLMQVSLSRLTALCHHDLPGDKASSLRAHMGPSHLGRDPGRDGSIRIAVRLKA